MAALNARIATVPNTPVSINMPSISPHTMPVMEFGVCAALCLFLVRGLWREHCAAERSERELTSKLIDNLIQKNAL